MKVRLINGFAILAIVIIMFVSLFIYTKLDKEKAVKEVIVTESVNSVTDNSVEETEVISDNNDINTESENSVIEDYHYIDTFRWVMDNEAGPKYLEKTYEQYKDYIEWDVVYQRGLEFSGEIDYSGKLDEKQFENEYCYPIIEKDNSEFANLEYNSFRSGTKEEFISSLDSIDKNDWKLSLVLYGLPQYTESAYNKLYGKQFKDDVTKEEFKNEVIKAVETASKFYLPQDNSPGDYPKVVDNKMVIVTEDVFRLYEYTLYINEKGKIYKIDSKEQIKAGMEKATLPEEIQFLDSQSEESDLAIDKTVKQKHIKELRYALATQSAYPLYYGCKEKDYIYYSHPEKATDSDNVNTGLKLQYVKCRWEVTIMDVTEIVTILYGERVY